MIKFTMKFALVTGLVSLMSGSYYAQASDSYVQAAEDPMSHPSPTISEREDDDSVCDEEGILSRAALIFKKGTPEQRVIPFSALKDGVVDGSNNNLVFTTSKSRYGEFRGANTDKLVGYIAPCHMVHDLLNASYRKPTSSIVMLWRAGSESINEYKYLQYLATESYGDALHVDIYMEKSNILDDIYNTEERSKYIKHLMSNVWHISSSFGNKNAG